jgi:hypothetical protein
VELCPAKGHVTAAGVGNVSMRLLNDGESKSFGCDNGTLGTGVQRIREFTQPWVHGSVLVMHSDGVKTHWTLDDYPGLGRRHPGLGRRHPGLVAGRSVLNRMVQKLACLHPFQSQLIEESGRQVSTFFCYRPLGLTLHCPHPNYLRLARRPKIGHYLISRLHLLIKA